jgi:tetratricopeptide (TPR) repeat protein
VPAVWFNLGFLQQDTGDHFSAIANFDRALALDEKLDRAWYGKALSLIKTGRVEEAVPLLKRNTELQPMSPFGWYQLAHAYHRLGQSERAAKVIRKLSEFEPQVARQLERETGLRAAPGPSGQ